MRMSYLIGRRHKEKPAEATLISHIYLLRGGYIRPVANGIYSMLPPAFRVAAKIENIIREEMNAIDGQEIKMPVVLPRELWDETKRYDTVGSELLRFEDRTKHGMLLAMTHEEAVTALARTEATSYKDYPFMLYQIQTKFRDEARSRGGLIRVREFTMKDAYSFHRTQEDLDAYYDRCATAYHRIYARCGVPEVVSIQSDTGMMGGKVAHEYMLLTDSGEDKIAHCPECGYLANFEVASSVLPEPDAEEMKPLEEVATPGTSTIESLAAFLNMPESKLAKVVFYITESGKMVTVMIRGDIEVNEIKLAKVLKEPFAFANDAEIESISGVPGFATGIGLTGGIVVVDRSIASAPNLVCGANKKDTHLLNFNVKRDLPNAVIADIATVQEGQICPVCRKGHIQMRRGIEVGNIFKLGTFYTQSMHMTYADENGTEQTPIMGCYGIGVGRLVGSVIEAKHDDYGPIWPMTIAPWQVQLNVLKMEEGNTKTTAEQLYEDLESAGLEVLYDDRNLSPGTQFAEADLMGIPLRLIVSPRNLEKGMVEYKVRGRDEKGFIPLAEVVSFAREFVQKEIDKINAVA